MSSARVLPSTRHGQPSDRIPLVLLHGFAGDAVGWTNLQLALASRRETIAFDLPGHGAALDWPEIGNAGKAAKAVTESLDALALRRVHLAGHSMGGAVAALIALRDPDRVASLTLFAPGGFGREINAGLLRAFAMARDATTIARLIGTFYGKGFRMPRRLAAAIAFDRSEARLEALGKVAEAILDGEGQKTVDLTRLAETGIPVKVIWGIADQVIPISQTENLPPEFALHRVPGVGHMPHQEALPLSVRLTLELIAAE